MKSCSVWYLMLVELLDSWNVCYWVWMQLARFFVTRNHMKSRPFAWGYYTNPPSLPTWQAVDISKIWWAVQGKRGCFKAMNTFGFIFLSWNLVLMQGMPCYIVARWSRCVGWQKSKPSWPDFPEVNDAVLWVWENFRSGTYGPVDDAIHCRSLFFLKSIHQTSPIVFFGNLDKMWEFFCQKDMTAGFCMLGFKIDTLEYL